MKAGLIRRLRQLEGRVALQRCSNVVRRKLGQTTSEAIALHCASAGVATGSLTRFVVIPAPAESVAEWLEQHAPWP